MDHNFFKLNKYYQWYYAIIAARIAATPHGYSEIHHILPTCLGGTNSPENLVRLTAREHFVCHLLLVKMTSGIAKYKMERAVSAFRMTSPNSSRVLTPCQYQSIRELTSALPNPMSRPEVKAKHLNSIAQKIGYKDHETYVATIKAAFEKHKTVKHTALHTGHSQYAVRHLLIKQFGKEWVEEIRMLGLVDARARSAKSNRSRPKRNTNAEHNPNAYTWEAIAPDGSVSQIYGNRIAFCKERGISTTLDPAKLHLRRGWEFKKLNRIPKHNC